ncbi:MAG: hypothetical protein Q4B14_02245 [Clostridia bacterium]|nr:hypothetical protein [Clostridia bacterium]
MKFLKERKFKYGAIATVMTVCIIAVVVLFNVIVNILNQKINLQYDVTSNDFFEISEETKAYIPTIDKNIEILVLESKEDFRSIDSEYYNQASNIIDQYPQYSDKISVSYLDLDKHPNIATQYSQDNIKAADIIVRTESV